MIRVISFVLLPFNGTIFVRQFVLFLQAKQALVKANDMFDFAPILAQALLRKGGERGLEPWIKEATCAHKFKHIPNDRVLATMTKCVFQAGFVWRVIENKWPAFEKTFFNFDPQSLILLSPEQLDRISSDNRIVRNRQKVLSVPQNAAYIADVSADHKSFANFAAQWPENDFIGLCMHMKKFGCRLGGLSGPRILRKIGKDSFILTKDVVTALKAAGLEIADAPTSRSDLIKVQNSFNHWREQTGYSLTRLSKICACSIGNNFTEPV